MCKLELNEQLKEQTILAPLNKIVFSSEDKHIIGTSGLATCYGLVFYDAKKKLGMVSHASPSKCLSLLKIMMYYLKTQEKGEINYAFIPGYDNVLRNDFTILRELEDYLFSNAANNIDFIYLNDLDIYFHKDTESYEFAFDVNTGTSVSNILFNKDIPADNKRKIPF